MHFMYIIKQGNGLPAQKNHTERFTRGIMSDARTFVTL